MDNLHLNENLLYTDLFDRYGIYQITSGSVMDKFKFMRLDYVMTAGGKVDKNGYQLVYTDRLEAGESLDSLYEKFNLFHPEDYRGHSLSVSDVIVLRKQGELKAYYVDSFGFAEVPEFMRNKEWDLEKSIAGMQQVAISIGDYFLTIQENDEGYDYSIYRNDCSLMDGGIYDNPDETMINILRFVIEDDLKLDLAHAELIDYEDLMGKVEEIERTSIINNQLNDKKQDIWLEYYVAECEEFHHLKGYKVYKNLEEAASDYRILREDKRKSYLGNSLGIIYHDNNDQILNESEYPFIMGEVIHADGLDEVKHFAESPEVCRAVAKIQELFPDYQVIEPKSLQNAMYPEMMTAEELADGLMDLVKESDFYNFQDSLETIENQKQHIVMDLAYGNKKSYIRILNEMIEDDLQEAPQAKLLLKRIKDYKSDHYLVNEPIVRICNFENNLFVPGSYYKLSEIEKKIYEISEGVNERNGSKSEYDVQKENYLLEYTLYYEINGEKQKMDSYLDIGSSRLGIVQSIREQTEEKLSDASWLDYIKNKGEEVYKSYMSELTDIQDNVLPYLLQFVTLPEREHIVKHVQETNTEQNKKSQFPDIGMKNKFDESKLSIHERIERNKEILVGKNGRNTEINEIVRG